MKLGNHRDLLIELGLILGLWLLVCAALVLLSGCSTTPTVPKTVTVVVEKFKPLPPEIDPELPLPQPADGTVREHLRSEDGRGAVINYSNCLRQLRRRVEAGEAVTGKECQAP